MQQVHDVRAADHGFLERGGAGRAHGVEAVQRDHRQDLDELPVAIVRAGPAAHAAASSSRQVPVLERRTIAQRTGLALERRHVVPRVVERLAALEPARVLADHDLPSQTTTIRSRRRAASPPARRRTGTRRCSGCARSRPGARSRTAPSARPHSRRTGRHRRSVRALLVPQLDDLALGLLGVGVARGRAARNAPRATRSAPPGSRKRTFGVNSHSRTCRPGSRPDPSPSPRRACTPSARSGSGCTSRGSGGCSGAPCPRRSHRPRSSCCRRCRVAGCRPRTRTPAHAPRTPSPGSRAGTPPGRTRGCTQPQVRHLHHLVYAAELDVLVAPVELVRLARREALRDERLVPRCAASEGRTCRRTLSTAPV
jgi:hypothetical protein